MHTFTALYDKRADAEAMQARLETIGVIDIDDGARDPEAAQIERAVAAEDRSDKSYWSGGRGAVPPEADRHIYEEAVKRGGYLVTVNVDDDRADEVHALLEGSNAVDFEEREQALKAQGFVPPVAPPTATRADAADDEVIPLVEEQLLVGRRQVDRGGVRVRSYVVDTPVHDQVSLREERVDVQRRPVDVRIADAETLFQERDITLNETAEEAVIGKEARVVEEVIVRKDVGERVETVNDTVRHTEVEVERTDGRDPKRG